MFKCREYTKRFKCCEHDHSQKKEENKTDIKIESPTDIANGKVRYTVITNENISIEVKEGCDE